MDVHDLSLADKKQILYNHLKFGNQQPDFRRAVKPFLAAACRVDPFLPEVARRFGNSRFTENVDRNRFSVVRFFAHPTDHLRDVIRNLTPDGRAALALIFMAGGQLPSPIELSDEQARALSVLGSTLSGASTAMLDLQGSLVTMVDADESEPDSHWEFKHPTVGEAYRSLIEADPRFMTIYLAGASLYALLNETTCGDRAIEGALLVPRTEWPTIARRIADLDSSIMSDSKDSYLAQRTSCEFLASYVQEHDPGLLDNANPRAAVRLRDCGLLPESRRVRLSESYATAFFTKLDSRAVSDSGLSLLSDAEIDALLDRVEREMIPDFAARVEEFEDSYDGAVSADDWLSDPLDALQALEALMRSRARKAAAALVEEAINDLEGLEDHLRQREEREPDFDDDYHSDRELVLADESDFDVFSDVDA